MVEKKRKSAEAPTAAQSDISETASSSSRPMSPQLETLWRRFCGNPFATALDKWAREVPDAEAVVWLNGEGDISETRTYKELVGQVYKLVGHLAEIGIKKDDRVILCYPPGIDFITAFYSCLVSGIVAVPVYPPDPTKGVSDVPRFCDIAENAGTSRALTSTTYRRVAAAMSVVSWEKRWKDVEWICTDTLKENAVPVSRALPTLDPHGIAFLQVCQVVTHEALSARRPRCSYLMLQRTAVLQADVSLPSLRRSVCCYRCTVYLGKYI